MRRLELSECIPSVHFLEKKEARGVEWSEILDILKNPSVVENHLGKWRYVKGDLAIVVANPFVSSMGQIGASPVLVTILLRRDEKWTDEDVKSRG